ncbi:AraC family transcriptional regulator [Paraburkholderia unamae]|nr:AraC family transcriptional regulator [Paraburkholderia unamae]
MPSFYLSRKSAVFDGADPREVSDYVNHAVGRHSIRVSAKTQPGARLLLRKVCEIGLCNISYGARVEISTESLRDSYQLQVLLRGTSMWTGDQNTYEFNPGEFLVINPADPARVQYSSDCEKLIVTLPVDVVEAMSCEANDSRGDKRVRFLRPVQTLACVDGLAGLLALMCEESENATCSPEIQRQYSQILVRKLLTQLETNVLERQTHEPSVAFERIKKYILDHLYDDLSPETVAFASNVSLRKMYALFKLHAKESPRSFIQRLKFDRVRADLLNARTSDSVTEIATRYGFSHLSRFSAAYRARYGELPSHTLSRSR